MKKILKTIVELFRAVAAWPWQNDDYEEFKGISHNYLLVYIGPDARICRDIAGNLDDIEKKISDLEDLGKIKAYSVFSCGLDNVHIYSNHTK